MIGHNEIATDALIDSQKPMVSSNQARDGNVCRLTGKLANKHLWQHVSQQNELEISDAYPLHIVSMGENTISMEFNGS